MPSVQCVDLAFVVAIVVIIISVAVTRIAVRMAEARPEAPKATARVKATRESRTASDATSSKAAEPSSPERAAHTSDVTAPEAATAAPRLRSGYGQSAGQERASQNHRQPFQHGMLLLYAATHPPRGDRRKQWVISEINIRVESTSYLPFC
jgi:cytoskeletal protein RodZ